MTELFIGGERVGSSSGEIRNVLHPADGHLVAIFHEGSASDTVAAIDAARSAFDSGHWRSFSGEQRGKILEQVADILERDKARFAEAESADTAKRIIEANYDMDDIISVFRYFATQATLSHEREVTTGRENIRSTMVSEPVGVIAMITPWNYPLLQASWKIAPALAAGCTFVIKPSELTPSTTSMLMDVLSEAGLPAGVANLVLGSGAVAGGPLSTHPGVDMVSFTGSLATGKRLMVNAAETVKKVALELGGKNPNIIFADADLDAAIDNALTAV
ncbi:MAG: aldehyde dehydrogenase family protein, partial [Actinomycetes bacterium]